MYTGTLISDLLALAERVRDASIERQYASGRGVGHEGGLKSEEFAQALGLSAADGDLGLFFVVHPKLVGTLEPGNNFADTVDVHQVGAVSAPE
jgi:hypothetical protein